VARPPQTLPLVAPELAHRPATGAVELALAEALETGRTRPARVTGVIVAALERIGAEPASVEVAWALATGTRERLLQLIAARRRPAPDWREAVCEHCGQRYDVEVDLEALPIKPPDGPFPVVELDTSGGRRRFEVPNGYHEEVLAARGAVGESAARMLLTLASLDDDASEAVGGFTPRDLAAIDEALERASPEAVEMLDSICPSCGAPTRARIDPLFGLFPRTDGVLDEVHALAAAYGWSEGEILALPEGRRRRYLERVAASSRQSVA
jgi:hypothetical protein